VKPSRSCPLGVRTADQVRAPGEGEGWQTRSAGPTVGVHERGRGPGDSFSLPYFSVRDIAEALENVQTLGGSIVHPGGALGSLQGLRGNPLRVGPGTVRGVAQPVRALWAAELLQTLV
jgi:hypothetical protein